MGDRLQTDDSSFVNVQKYVFGPSLGNRCEDQTLEEASRHATDIFSQPEDTAPALRTTSQQVFI